MRAAILLAACAVTGALALTACGGDDGDDSGASASPRPSAPQSSNFSGEPPSSMASGAASKKAEAKKSASAAASSASQRAHDFEASVAADVEGDRPEDQKQVEAAEGRGNAGSAVSLAGKPLSETGNVRALVVHITNKTDETAS